MQRHKSAGTISRPPGTKPGKPRDFTLCMHCLQEIEKLRRDVNCQEVNGYSCSLLAYRTRYINTKFEVRSFNTT